MSELDRVINLGRAYATKAHDAVFGKESVEEKAVKELDQALEEGITLKKSEQQVATDQIAAMTEAEAVTVLGISSNASYAQLKTQYQLLLSHVDDFSQKEPSKKEVADRERKRIEKAFSLLSAKSDSTEKRFGSLEIE
ncbi:MAG: hypothetical protein JST12_03125 [Armatimonadetes bacterium]|nr:hypothetical protein [Armatimonadota bacterium]MBS1700626.1 hypothetical protein [Armatimonadota bacterium]